MDHDVEAASGHGPPVDARLAGVLRLTTELADRILDAQIMKRPVPEDQVRALASAAQLLRDHGVEWPPLLTQVLHEIGTGVMDDQDEALTPTEEGKAKNLAWLLRPFQGRK